MSSDGKPAAPRRGRPPAHLRADKGAPDSDKTRRLRSDADKLARGEVRLHTWINAEAADVLRELTAGSGRRGAVQAALQFALTRLVRDALDRGDPEVAAFVESMRGD
ncbi:hypothetical protein [Burkholderia gladioli]|uniref:hypothetical protein n=1 Tax=Burkholderia gladioli TaxID=28095 RepID=UPI00163F35CF|nr:hypothetical protein [Burkholderia gladioli]